MRRNEWRLPSLKCGVITREYLRKVRAKELYAPHGKKLETVECIEPPRKDVIFEQVMSFAQLKGV